MSDDLWLQITPIDILKPLSYIVDMTADITVLQATYNGQIKALFRATGEDCGDDIFC